MKGPQFALILAGVLLNAIAQLLLKAGAGSLAGIELRAGNALAIASRMLYSMPILAGLACYVLSVVVWILALSRVEVSVAYPMLSIGYVVNALAAWWLFGENLSGVRVAGIGIILLGVWLVARSSGAGAS
jgi:multidrug transporter EmrE-like cation transporter